jgi:hypothetical protein
LNLNEYFMLEFKRFGAAKKCRALHDMIVEHKVDIITIQEIKKCTFTPRMLKGISHHFDVWLELPTLGLSGGILVDCDGSKVIVDKSEILNFSITIFFTNRVDNLNGA